MVFVATPREIDFSRSPTIRLIITHTLEHTTFKCLISAFGPTRSECPTLRSEGIAHALHKVKHITGGFSRSHTSVVFHQDFTFQVSTLEVRGSSGGRPMLTIARMLTLTVDIASPTIRHGRMKGPKTASPQASLKSFLVTRRTSLKRMLYR